MQAGTDNRDGVQWLEEPNFSGDGVLPLGASDDASRRPCGPNSALEHPLPEQDSPPEVIAGVANAFTSKRVACCLCCQAFMGTLLVLAVIGIGMILKPPSLETNFNSFMEADVPSFITNKGFHDAVAKLYEDEQSGRRLMYAYKDMIIYLSYEAAEGMELPLSAIGALESRLRALPRWQVLCSTEWIQEKDLPLCNPGISLANYVSPGREYAEFDFVNDNIVPERLDLRTKYREALPQEATLYLFERGGNVKAAFPADYAPGTGEAPRQLRSIFQFYLICCPMSTPPSEQRAWARERKDEWKAFIAEDVLPILQSVASPSWRVSWDGSEFSGVEVMEVVAGDRSFAIGSMTFVLMYLLFHTRSLVMGVVGLFTVIIAVPLAYVAFAFSTGSTTMNIASFLSLFLIVGLGSDVVFVYTDVWLESINHKDTVHERLSWTYRHAGKATLATSSATALSFFANLASVLRSLREFGYFMGLCVMFVWLLVPMIYTPLLVLTQHYCKGCVHPLRWLSLCFCCSCEIRGKKAHQEPERLFRRLAFHLRRFRYCYFFVPVSVAVLATFLAVKFASLSGDTPTLLPEEHNLNYKGKAMAPFIDISEFSGGLLIPATTVHICPPSQPDLGKCDISWCEALDLEHAGDYYEEEQETPVGTNSGDNCACYRTQRNPCTYSSMQRYVDLPGIGDEELERLARDYLRETGIPQVNGFSSKKILKTMLQNWLRDYSVIKDVQQVDFTLPDGNCGFDDLCFCGDLACNFVFEDTWQQLPNLNFTGRRLVDGSASRNNLQTPSSTARILAATWQKHNPQLKTLELRVPVNRRASVVVAFGLSVTSSSPLLGKSDESGSWAFNPAFTARDPWMQRDMYSFCANAPHQLRIVDDACWIADFRSFAESRGNVRFPVLGGFDDLLEGFVRDGMIEFRSQVLASTNFLWMREGRLKAAYMKFVVDIDILSSVNEVFEYKQRWDDYIAEHNGPIPSTTAAAFHTSDFWVRAEVQMQLVSSVVMTLGTVAVLAFLAMLIFTGSSVLSFYVVVATACVIGQLLFAIVHIMNLAIGPIEIIALIVFVGYSVTYSLHVAHHYGETEAVDEPIPDYFDLQPGPTLRLVRVTFALNAIGPATLGSALTTMGCSVFLLFCKIIIFKKLGSVAIAVTVLSIAMALVVLPAGLLLFGPLHPGRLPSRIHRFFERCQLACKFNLRRKVDNTDDDSPSIPSTKQPEFLGGGSDDPSTNAEEGKSSNDGSFHMTLWPQDDGAMITM